MHRNIQVNKLTNIDRYAGSTCFSTLIIPVVLNDSQLSFVSGILVPVVCAFKNRVAV